MIPTEFHDNLKETPNHPLEGANYKLCNEHRHQEELNLILAHQRFKLYMENAPTKINLRNNDDENRKRLLQLAYQGQNLYYLPQK